jgi:hypothetical protein
MGKKLFFLSLIILSVAMGMKWHKTRPLTKKGPVRQRVALNLQDLELQDDKNAGAGDESTSDSGGEGGEGEEPAEGALEGEGDPENSEGTDENPEDTDPDAGENVASGTSNLDPLLNDPIILALKKMKRDPFERSPYAKLVEDLQKKEEMAAMPVEKKSVQLLPANFTATIETRKELVAVIDSRLYRKGDAFGDKKIADIKNEIISLESGKDTFLIPKRGVNVNIAEDGTYTVEDSYHKN